MSCTDGAKSTQVNQTPKKSTFDLITRTKYYLTRLFTSLTHLANKKALIGDNKRFPIKKVKVFIIISPKEIL